MRGYDYGGCDRIREACDGYDDAVHCAYHVDYRHRRAESANCPVCTCQCDSPHLVQGSPMNAWSDIDGQSLELEAFPRSPFQPASRQLPNEQIHVSSLSAEAAAEANAAVASMSLGAGSALEQSGGGAVRGSQRSHIQFAEDAKSPEKKSNGSKSQTSSFARSRSTFGSIGSGMSFTSKRQRSEESSMAITHQVLGDSAALREEASKMLHRAASHGEVQAAKNAVVGLQVQDKLKKRIENTEALASDLEESLASVEPVTYLLQQCIHNLERAHKNAWPLMSVAKQRQTLREKCPTGELDKDYLQLALKYEQKMLKRGRQQMARKKEEGQELLEELDKHMKKMREALPEKRFAAEHDKACLSVAQEKEAVSSKLLKASKKTQVDREAWASSVRELLASIAELETKAREYREECHELIEDKKRTADEAAANTLDLFRRHSGEMTRLRKLVEKEIHQSHQAISSVDQTIRETKRQIAKMKNSVSNVSRKLSLVKSNPQHRERSTLVDTVQSSSDRVLSKYKALEEQLVWAQRLAYDLGESHSMLEDDHAMKTMAMKYTEHCLLVTPEPDEDPRTVRSRSLLRDRAAKCTAHYIEIKASTLIELRRRMRAAASTGPSGRMDLDALFERMNKNREPVLTDQAVKNAVRKVLRIGPDVISDAQIATFCAILDEDDSGTVDVIELRNFIEKEAVIKDARDFEFSMPDMIESARENQMAAQVQERPPFELLPPLKPSQLSNLRKRIRGAAWIAAQNQGIVPGPDGELAALFDQYDKNGGGDIDDLEFRKAIRTGLRIPKTQISDTELWTLIYMIDRDNSGAIDIQEFIHWVHSE